MIRRFKFLTGKQKIMIFNLRKTLSGVVFSMGIIAGAAQAQSLALDSEPKKQGYAIGTMVGGQILQQFTQDGSIDIEALAAGVSDAINAKSQMSVEEATAIFEAYRAQVLAEAQAQAAEQAQASQNFLEQNRTKEGVMVTESGLQYSIITSGDESGSHPTKDDSVVVHYRGTLTDGREFDSSYSRNTPITFPVTGVIPGWTEGLQLMRPGDKWEFVIPSELAYGERGAGGLIGPNATLIFEVELLEIK